MTACSRGSGALFEIIVAHVERVDIGNDALATHQLFPAFRVGAASSVRCSVVGEEIASSLKISSRSSRISRSFGRFKAIRRPSELRMVRSTLMLEGEPVMEYPARCGLFHLDLLETTLHKIGQFHVLEKKIEELFARQHEQEIILHLHRNRCPALPPPPPPPAGGFLILSPVLKDLLPVEAYSRRPALVE